MFGDTQNIIVGMTENTQTNSEDVLKCKDCIHFDESREADERCLHPFGFSCQHFNEMLESNQE